MNRSYSKIRHIQEANQRLEKRMIKEQFAGEFRNDEPSFEPDEFEMRIKDTRNTQLEDIINNFESINCDGISDMSAESLYGERPERDIIYCTSYRGKSKEDLINVLHGLSESDNLSEQSSNDVSCLLNSGYKKETIGGPMTRREVYTTKKDGMTYQISINGGVRVFGNKTHKQGKWSCENGKVKISGLKDTPNMPM